MGLDNINMVINYNDGNIYLFPVSTDAAVVKTHSLLSLLSSLLAVRSRSYSCQ